MFPNKSLISNVLLGIYKWDNSKNIEIEKV